MPDPRAHNIVHPLPNIFLSALLAVICGANDWPEVVLWGRAKQKWRATFLDLTKGIPSRDTFRRGIAN